MVARLYAPRGVEMAYKLTGPVTRGYLCEVGQVALRARSQTITLHLDLFTSCGVHNATDALVMLQFGQDKSRRSPSIKSISELKKNYKKRKERGCGEKVYKNTDFLFNCSKQKSEP